DCTLPAALAAALGAEYDWLLGCSGEAFRTGIDEETWDPLAAAPRGERTAAEMARAAGIRLDPVAPPYDDEMRALVTDRIAESVDAHLPPLVRGLGGPPEYGLLIGYDLDGPAFFARTFFDKSEDARRVGWEAFADAERGGITFLDRVTAPDRAASVREGIAAALAAGDESDQALEAWAAALRDDARGDAVSDQLAAAILGLIQGLTEFLPVSSTAHLILASDVLKLDATKFGLSFDVALHLGTALAVLLYFAGTWWSLVADLAHGR